MSSLVQGADSVEPAAGRLRVATWNLWWHFGPWEERQPAIRETMQAVDADVWCIQEVFRGRDAGDQAEELADALGGYHVAHGTRFDLDRFSESIGNAVISRFPIRDWEIRALSAPAGLDELRLVVRADIEAPGHVVEVFSTHLNYRLDQSHVRQEQVRELCAFVDETTDRRTFPPIVCGDFNADPGAEEIRMLTGLTSVPVPKLVFIDAWRAGGTDEGSTWDNRNAHAAQDFEPNRRIDYVLVGYPREAGIGQVVEARLVGDQPVDGVWPSDHFGVVADIRI